MRFDRAAAVQLARAAERVVAIRGKAVVAYDMRHDPPDDDALARAIIGPTGNLRAPTVRVGGDLLVGFDADVWRGRR